MTPGAMSERVPPVVHERGPADWDQLREQMPARVHGPRAMTGSFRRFVRLTWMLAYLDFKLKFFGSVLGYAWQLVRPLMMFAVLYVVFSQILRFGSVPYYPVVLLSGIVLYNFFSESTNGAVTSIVDSEGLVRKIAFPLLAVPLSRVTSLFLTLGLNYLVVIVFALLSGVDPGIRWIEILPIMVLLYVLSAGVAAGLAALYVRYRDIFPIWEVLAQVFFYASPVIWPVEMVHNATVLKIVMCNPVAALIQQARHAVIDPASPSVVDVMGSWELLAIPVGISILLVVAGFALIRRGAPHVAEEV